MPVVVEIPGGELEFPDHFTDDQIAQATREHVFGVTERDISKGSVLPEIPREPVESDLGPGATFGLSVGESFVDNLLKLPSVAGGALNVASSAVATVPGSLGRLATGQPVEFERRLEEFKEIGDPLTDLLQTELPDTLNIGAAVDALKGGDDLALRFRVAKQQREQQREARREENPLASMLGSGFGDALTLLTGRAPIVRARAPGQTAKREAAEAAFEDIPASVRSNFTDIVTSGIAPFFKETAQLLQRAGGKAAGVGLEAATLAALNDSDPQSAFWVGAGTQAAGSASLFISEKAIKHPLGFVATAWLASEMFKAAAPGDQNFFESKDFSIQKAVGALSLGAIAGLAGLGRLRGPTAERAPVFMDAITTIPRGTVLSILEQLRDSQASGNSVPLQVLNKISTEPDIFSENEAKRLERALNSEKKGEFIKEVERMLQNPEFAKLLGE